MNKTELIHTLTYTIEDCSKELKIYSDGSIDNYELQEHISGIKWSIKTISEILIKLAEKS